MDVEGETQTDAWAKTQGIDEAATRIRDPRGTLAPTRLMGLSGARRAFAEMADDQPQIRKAVEEGK